MKRFILFALFIPFTLWAEPLRIDLSMDTGRKDTAAAGWEEWQVSSGHRVSRSFGDVEVVLEMLEGKEPGLQGKWHKPGLATGAHMATDGVVVYGNGGGAILAVRLRGLPPGRHSLVTYHNVVTDEPYETLTVSTSRNISGVGIKPTHRVASDEEAASVYTEFDIVEGKEFVLKIACTDEIEPRSVILNGLEIDASNPERKARSPFPVYGDLHVDGDSGTVRLGWDPSPHTVRHEVFFARSDTESGARALVSGAQSNSPLHVSTIPGNAQVVKVDDHNSQLHYAWRVDSVDGDGAVTRGDVWTFRVRQVAFPGAEGYGRFAIGGRGGRVIKVTNLEDSGPGSLRAAVEAEGPRTVVFNVSGRIVLKDKLVIRNPYLTIAGHTAPGKGICLSNYNMGMMGAHDVIIRHMRVRPGDTSGKTLDGMGMAASDHCIIDHCSISWTQDESFSSRSGRNITLQRTLISEALNVAGHKKYAEGKQHGYAASISGDIGSFHHNLLAHCAGRNWSLAGGLDLAGVHAGRLDIRNNVVYNWGYRTTDGGAKEVNFVGNYYKPGPASTVFHVLKPERNHVFGPQDYYVEGNVMEGYYGAEERYAGIVEPKDEPMENFLVDEPFFPSFVTTRSAEEAYASVLADVGANVPVLDDHDKRIIEETRLGSARYKGSRSGLPGLPDSQADVGGWEDYPVVWRPADYDVDNDGLPDAWERVKGLDPRNPADARIDSDGDGYTHLEAFLHWLAAGHQMEALSI